MDKNNVNKTLDIEINLLLKNADKFNKESLYVEINKQKLLNLSGLN